LFGLFGMLIALPVAAVGKVLIGFVHERYIASRFYGAAPADPVESAPAAALAPVAGSDGDGDGETPPPPTA
jgi:hypothetical protein